MTDTLDNFEENAEVLNVSNSLHLLCVYVYIFFIINQKLVDQWFSLQMTAVNGLHFYNAFQRGFTTIDMNLETNGCFNAYTDETHRRQ